MLEKSPRPVVIWVVGTQLVVAQEKKCWGGASAAKVLTVSGVKKFNGKAYRID